MAFQFELAGAQIDGARDYQEDAFLITHLTDAEGNPSALIIVADGMGGHAAGNVASNMAVQAFNKHVSANYPTDDPSNILYECVIMANNSIKDTVNETPALAGMGCTMVAAILEDGKIWWVSVGDSHLYILRDKELLKKNADHSYGGFLDRMEEAGTPMDPEPGLARNMLMSAVTGDEINEVDVSTEPFELQVGDRIILCSDGMDTLSDGKIIQFCEWSGTPKDCTQALLAAVEDAEMPKQDNTTVVVVDVKEKDGITAAPKPAEEAVAEVAAGNRAAAPITAEKTIPDIKVAIGKGKKTGMVIGLAAVIVIGIALSIYMALGGKETAPPASPAATETEPETAPARPPAEQASAPATAAPAARKEQPRPEQPAVTAKPAPPKTKVREKQKVAAPVVVKVQEFHDTLKDGTPGPTMVWIPAGTYEMGGPTTSTIAEERPQHKVTIRRFAMSKFEITFAQYEKFARATHRHRPNNMHMDKKTYPVINVKWDDAYRYAKWLSQQTGKKYHLPSESEWEYAASGGKASTFWWGFDEKPGMAHCFSCGDDLNARLPTRVGSFAPNPFGVYDTAGNAAEWTQDCWHKDYNGAPSDGSVWKGGDCSYRVVRGGSYGSPAASIRHSKRDKFKADSRYDFIGIRVVRDP
jgi:formylglycine-generating enzyme required for sulfatase activity/serine/threonine protein phosphatase PrpC